MANEIVNKLRGKSTIFITGNTSTLVTLNNLSASAAETVTSAAITNVITSSDGKWSVFRGNDGNGVKVLELFGQNNLQLKQDDIVVANTATANLYFTNSGTGGTLIMVVSKTATYSPSLSGM